MSKDEIRATIDRENGAGFSANINLKGYVFTKRGSFIVFELKDVDGVKVCHIKYIHFENEADLTTIMVHCCNFWMNTRVQFIFYREKDRSGNSPLQFLRDLNFREEIMDWSWKWRFDCDGCHAVPCRCAVHQMYK